MGVFSYVIPEQNEWCFLSENRKGALKERSGAFYAALVFMLLLSLLLLPCSCPCFYALAPLLWFFTFVSPNKSLKKWGGAELVFIFMFLCFYASMLLCFYVSVFLCFHICYQINHAEKLLCSYL